MKSIMVCFLLIQLSYLCPVSVYSQTLHATVRGQLTDSTGSVLQGVALKAIQEETLESYQASSGPEGEYTFSMLPPGIYRFEAEKEGFRKYVQSGVRLNVGQNARLNIPLEAGNPEDTVIFVYSNQGMVEPDATNAGAVVENRQIVNLPLDKRNFLQLSLLLPGAVPSAQGSPGSVRDEFSVNVNGTREDSNNFILDGVFNNDPKLNSFAINPPVDAIHEFEILTSTYDAGFGRGGGAQVNIALKSGTNRFHGTAYEFFQNASLNARNYFARSDEGKPRFQHNQYGFSLGGPIIPNRTFFFADYEGRRERKAITQLASVPTALERGGDFSQSLYMPYEQYAMDGMIPPYYMNEVGIAVANLYPLPNYEGPGGNFVSSPILRRREDRFDVRIDHSFAERSRLISRFSFSDHDLYDPFSGPAFSRVPGYGVQIARRAQNFMLGEDHTFSPALINQVRFAFNRVSFGSVQESRIDGLNQMVGIPELSDNPRDHGLSFIRVSGFSPIGDEYNNPQQSTTNVFQFTDTMNYSFRKHLFKIGFDFRALQQNAFRDVQSRGFFKLYRIDYGHQHVRSSDGTAHGYRRRAARQPSIPQIQ